jgi:thiol-disulfide isomerase/thioredoxin
MDEPAESIAPDNETAAAEVAPGESRPARRRSRRAPEVRIGFPGWAPFAFVGIFALGVVLGVVLMVLVDDDPAVVSADSAEAVAPVPSGNASAVDDGSPSDDDPLGYGSVQITGTPLPRLPQSGADAAIGMPAPGLTGADFEGNSVVIPNDDGQAKLILFVAHWCPYCREEVPKVRDWVDVTQFPANVDVYSVSTLTDATRSNYPPATWFALEGWNVPLIADDGADSAANAFGLNAVPFWVLVNADGTIAGRGAGAVPTEVLDNVVSELSTAATS